MSHILSSRDPEHVRFLTSALDLKALLYSKADQRQGRCLIGTSAIRVAALKCKAEKHLGAVRDGLMMPEWVGV